MNDLCKLAFIILILPLVGFVIQVFFGKKIPPRKRQGDWIPTLAIFGSFVIACYMVGLLLLSPGGITAQLWYPLAGANWMSVGSAPEAGAQATGGVILNFGILVDNLTIIMLFVVTLVSFLVHLYSWGYMHGEERYNRFFAYLGLFTFSMLGLCITSNLLFLFMFWELVGVCSYFLIGFYVEKKSAQNAAIKAFMTTRLGDIGFFIALLMIFSVVGSFEFSDIFASVERGDWAVPLLTTAAICLFLGPVGKSAQFPLHVWLPDAMEGPTPVSALIHAATMVAAGVYLVGRMFPFMAGAPYFQGDFYSSDALMVVALVGGITAFFAATIAFAQTDIKKVLAYSTVSQLGYMMIGLGVGSVSAGLFHLTTHAFFKALLFLAAGSVIHAVHSNELKDMGGLRKKLPVTYWTFLIGTLALAGLPYLSGFFSKEAILGNALAFARYNEESQTFSSIAAHLPFVLGLLTAGMTAFYMFRVFFATFHGEPRNQHSYEHAHESPWTMTVPLCVLAVLAIFAGDIISKHWFEHRVASSVLVPVADLTIYQHVQHLLHEEVHVPVMIASIMLFVVGLVLAALFFLPIGKFYRRDVCAPGTPLGATRNFLANLWYIDRIWTWIALHVIHVSQWAVGSFDKYVVDGCVNASTTLCRYILGVTGALDFWGVDGVVRGIGDSSLRAGARLRRMQTGMLQEYIYASVFIFAGLCLVSAVIVVFVW